MLKKPYQTESLQHTSLITRRQFIALGLVSPILIFSSNSHGVFPLVGWIFTGVRAARVASTIARGTSAVTRSTRTASSRSPVVKTVTNKESTGKVSFRDAIEVIDTGSTVIDASNYLKDTLWEPEDDNDVSIVINNPSEKNHDTGEILLDIQDKDTGNSAIEAKIEPIEIPPRSNIVLDLGVSNLYSPGVKRIIGSYNYGNNSMNSSGDIVIPASTCEGKLIQVEQFISTREYSKAWTMINRAALELHDSCDANNIDKYKSLQKTLRSI